MTWARLLVRNHRWTSFLALSRGWARDDVTKLFDECFGKSTKTDIKSLLDDIPIQSRVCAVYAQLDIGLPTIEDARRHMRSQSISPPLRTSSVQPSPVQISSTSLNSIPTSESADQVLAFLQSIEELREEALLWSIALYGDTTALSELAESGPELASELHRFFSTHSQLKWIASRFSM